MARKLTKKQQSAVKQLEELAKNLGLKVSYGRLRFAGLKLKPGQCLFRGQNWLVMDRQMAYEDRLEAFREAFSVYDLTHLELSPEMKRVLDPAGARRQNDRPA